MAEVIDHVPTETIVKMAELKEKLKEEQGELFDKYEHDPEARRSAVVDYVKMFSGKYFTGKDIDDYYHWPVGTATRFIAEMLAKGRMSYTTMSQKEKIEAGIALQGAKRIYHYHPTPLAVTDRTKPQRYTKGQEAVMSRRDPELVENIRQEKIAAEAQRMAQIRQKALDAATTARSQVDAVIGNKERQAWLEQKVWEFLRDADPQENMLEVMRAFVKFAE